MPSPIGHSLAGLCGYMLVRQGVAPVRQRWLVVAGAIAIANLPDLDVLPALVCGGGSAHRQWSHSLMAALAFGGLTAIVAKRLGSSAVHWGTWGGLLYFSHIVLDMLLDDPSLPRGVQLLWPFSG